MEWVYSYNSGAHTGNWRAAQIAGKLSRLSTVIMILEGFRYICSIDFYSILCLQNVLCPLPPPAEHYQLAHTLTLNSFDSLCGEDFIYN